MEDVGTSSPGGDAAHSHSQTQFVLDLYKAVAEEAPHENVVLSPLSISLALAMVAAGAHGPTLQQMAACLHLPQTLMHTLSERLKAVLKADAKQHGLELSCANSIWVDESIHLKPSFQSVLSHSYGAEAASVDFAHKAEDSRGRVNKWAEDETRGKIKDVLPKGSVTAGTRVILANAIYFKGTWLEPFEQTSTRDGDFFVPDGTTVRVAMMNSSKRQHVRSLPSFKALRLPYRLRGDNTRAFSMIVLLPHAKNGLREMEATLDIQKVVDDLSNFNEKMQMSKFWLPKFKISFGTQLSTTLKALGMELLFEGGADLSNMTDAGEAICVSSVHHKAFVEVNETGTEAAAVTTVMVSFCCAAIGKREEFVADHPFMFLIKEESTDTIIFTGRVVDPSKK